MSYRNVLTELEEKLLQLKFKEKRTHGTTKNKVQSTVLWNIVPYSLVEQASNMELAIWVILIFFGCVI
jgi:hypothetical protein